MGIINMNGRIYDPLIGRFMSADPKIPRPYNLQSFNRYSYAYNRPLKFVDMNGYDARDSGSGSFIPNDPGAIAPTPESNGGPTGSGNGTGTYQPPAIPGSNQPRPPANTPVGAGSADTQNPNPPAVPPVSDPTPPQRKVEPINVAQDDGSYQLAQVSRRFMPTNPTIPGAGNGGNIYDDGQPVGGGYGYSSSPTSTDIPRIPQIDFDIRSLILPLPIRIGWELIMSVSGTDQPADKPSLSDHKDALDKVHDKVGKLPKGEDGKFGSPQAGDSKKGYRLDPPHDNAKPGSAESKHHFNWWDFTRGKRGKGGDSGAIPIGR